MLTAKRPFRRMNDEPGWRGCVLWLGTRSDTTPLPLGYFGAIPGATYLFDEPGALQQVARPRL